MRELLEIREAKGGLLLPVKAHPGARRSAVTGLHDGALKLSVTQAPEKDKANRALVQLLSRTLDLKKSQISLAGGETSSQKTFFIQGVNATTLEERIRRALNGS